MLQLSLPMTVLVSLLVGLAGFVDASAGGGGLISLPAYLMAGVPVHIAYGCNKFSSACGTTFAVGNFLKNRAMDLKVALLAAAASFAGSGLASHLVLYLSDSFLKKLVLICLPVAACIILARRNLPDADTSASLSRNKKIVLALLIGFFMGSYDGLVGPGTGTFAILAFSAAMGYDLRKASGNAKLVNLASNYASLATYLMAGMVAFQLAIPCAVCNIVGATLGSHLALKKGAKYIRPMLLVVLVLLLGKLALDVITG